MFPSDWKVPPPIHDDNSTTSRSSTDSWEAPPSVHDDNLTKTELRSSAHDDNSTKKIPTDRKVSPDNVNSLKSIPIYTPSDRKVSPDNDNSLKTIPIYTPYLQLPHLLSLSWLAYPIISLIFVAFRLQLSLASAENGLEAARNDILSSCNAAQHAATGAASFPRYLASTSNQQFADSANGAMEAARVALILSLDAMEAILNYIIGSYRSTLLCVVELVVQGGLSLVTGAVGAIGTSVQNISSNIGTQVITANGAIASIVNAANTANKADPLHQITVPTISVSSLSGLQNLTVPPSFQQILATVNASVPTAAEVKKIVDDLVDTPFELLKQLINNTFNNLTFDPNIFPVPDENLLSFCHDIDLSSIDKISSDLNEAARIGTIILIGVALLLTGINCLLVWLKWRSVKKNLESTREAWGSDPLLNPTKASGSEPQIDAHTRSTPQQDNPTKSSGSDHAHSRSFSSNEKHTMSSVFEPQMDVHTRSSPSTRAQQNSPTQFSGSDPQIGAHTRSEKHTMSSVFEPQMDVHTPSSPQQNSPIKSSGSDPQIGAHSRSFSSSEKHMSSVFEPQMDVHTPYTPQQNNRKSSRSESVDLYFPSTPPNFTLSEGSEPQVDAHPTSFPSALSDPPPQHMYFGPEPQTGAHAEFSPSPPQVTLSDHNLLILQADSHHPVVARFLNYIAAQTGMTESQRIDMRWFFHYVFHPPALACFLIGLFGLLSVMIQLLLLGAVVAAVDAGVDAVVSDFSAEIAHSINRSMYNQSAAYANTINGKVDLVQSTIDAGLFKWIDNSTATLNTTINNFYTEVQNLVSSVFNGTPLEQPALNFLQCLIGSKVDDIEKALTFLHQNLAINLPRVNDSVLVLSPDLVNEATAPIASAAVGNGGSGGQGLIGGAINLYKDSLRTEAWVFSIFMGIWGIVVCMAICVLLWRFHRRKKAVAAARRQKRLSEKRIRLEERKKKREKDMEGRDKDIEGRDKDIEESLDKDIWDKNSEKGWDEESAERDKDIWDKNSEKGWDEESAERDRDIWDKNSEKDWDEESAEERDKDMEERDEIIVENPFSSADDEKKDLWMD